MAIEITDRSALPYSAVCYLEVTFANGLRARGSGVVVGPNDVLTALHVVYSAFDGGWARSVRILPGADTLPLTAPLGEFNDVQSFAGRVPDWDPNGDGLLFASESQYDMALLGLSSRIGDLSGWLPLDTERASFSAQVLGYPARGTGLMSDIGFAQPDNGSGTLNIGLGLGRGASGGPMIHSIDGDAYVAGTLSSGDAGLTTSRYAALFGPGNLQWLQEAIRANDNLVASQTPLRFQGDRGDDSLVGNVADNVLLGGAGADRFRGGGGSDLIDGGTGIDTVTLTGVRAQYQLQALSSFNTTTSGLPVGWQPSQQLQDTVASRDGALVLSRVERLEFRDMGVALDVSGQAGDVFALVGATLGADAARDTRILGMALGFLGRGQSLAALAQIALDMALGPMPDNRSVIGLLYQRFTDIVADSQALDAFSPLLSSGAYTPSSLALAVSEMTTHPARLALTGVNSLDYQLF